MDARICTDGDRMTVVMAATWRPERDDVRIRMPIGTGITFCE